jgi:hypothetical protein
MFTKFGKRHVVPILLSFCIAAPVLSQTTVLIRKASFNQGWKFLKSDPGVTAAGTGYSDASWAVVNIPHSASYDSATSQSSTTANGEQNYFVGTCWYRKTFTLPVTPQKVFIEFEGAMQVADLFINGDSVGEHNNSGYTPFVFDISNMVHSGSNVLALRLNNVRSASIPPGWANSGPDYYLFGGLTRAVWLHFKDSVYIPVYQQQVIPQPNAAATSSQLRVRTPVMNASGSALNAKVTVNLFDASNNLVNTDTATKSIPSGTLDTFDMTSTSFTCNPWSPATPYMYSVSTVVSVGGVTVDSVVEPCGFRVFTWTVANGFSINGTRTEIHGMCLHQNQAWIENAVSDERYYYEVKSIKAMGGNSIRCSHYPRAQAFYNACDKLGMLLYPEATSWGWSLTPTAACWARNDSCVKEMVLSARNHPCIYAWGLYNEPNGVSGTEPDFTTYITADNNTAHALDSTRLTAMANNGTSQNAIVVPDAIGWNYSQGSTVTINGKSTGNQPWFGTEARDGNTFGTMDSRGSLIDLDTSTTSSSGNDMDEWNSFSFSTATSGHLAGGHFWEYKDHGSTWNVTAYEGVVDRFDVPKTMYYYFGHRWNSAMATDYPRPGTATHIDFEVDTSVLPADSVNVFLLTAAMRDSAGRQISSDSGQVKFTLSDATKGIIFGGNLVKAYGGKAAAFLRTSKSAGSFSVIASYPSITTIPPDTINLITTAVSPEVYTVAATSVMGSRSQVVQQLHLGVISGTRGFTFHCPDEPGLLKIIDINGKTVWSKSVDKNASLTVSRKGFAAGLLYAEWSNGSRHLVKSLPNAY